jgi:hypothetical protein
VPSIAPSRSRATANPDLSVLVGIGHSGRRDPFVYVEDWYAAC